MTTVSTPEYEEELDLDRYRGFVVGHWRALLGCAGFGAAVALGLALLVPPRFEAGVTLVALPPPPGAASALMTAAEAKGLIAAPGVASRVVDELGLTRDGVTAPRLIEATDLQQRASGNQMRLSVVLRDPAQARAAAALLAEKLVAASGTANAEAASRVRAALEKPLADAQLRLKEAEAQLAQLMARTPDEVFDMPFDTSSRFDRPRLTTAPARPGTSRERRADLYAMRLDVSRLQAEYAARLSAYTSLRGKYDEVGSAGSEPQLKLDTTAPPDPPHALPRKRLQYAILGLLVGLIGGIVLALASDRRHIARR